MLESLKDFSYLYFNSSFKYWRLFPICGCLEIIRSLLRALFIRSLLRALSNFEIGYIYRDMQNQQVYELFLNAFYRKRKKCN